GHAAAPRVDGRWGRPSPAEQSPPPPRVRRAGVAAGDNAVRCAAGQRAPGKSGRPRTYRRRHGGSRVVVIERVVSNRLWHALDDDRVVGRAPLRRRPDDRAFVAADAWLEPVTRALLDAVAADVPGDLHTLAGEDDTDQLALLTAAGYAVLRRE